MSFQSLVRSTLLTGSSSVATTLVGILRVKALAMLLGPAGVGLLGVLASAASVGTTLAAVGSDTTGTRRIALDRDNSRGTARIRRTLLLIALAHGLVAMAGFWLLREPLARWLLGGPAHATEIGLLGSAVALSLVAGLQMAQLQGLARVGDIARINILSSAVGTVIGLAAVWAAGVAGLLALVLAQPAIAAVMATARTRHLGLPADASHDASLLRDIGDWAATLRQGAPYMVSFLVTAASPLVIRALVVHDLGIEAAGHFHAAWTLSVLYVAFLLNAMSVGYFPRLTTLASERAAASRLVDDQTQLALAIGGTALIVVLATAPVLVPLLYSSAFAPAAGIVEWQALGNLMKIAGWPIGYLLIAHGRSTMLVATEVAWNALLVGLVWVGLPHLGLAATGIAFAAASAFFLLMHIAVAYRVFGIGLGRRSVLMLVAFAAAGALTFAAARHSLALQLLTGGALSLGLGLASLRFIVQRLEGGGRVVALARRAFASLGWPMPLPLTPERS